MNHLINELNKYPTLCSEHAASISELENLLLLFFILINSLAAWDSRLEEWRYSPPNDSQPNYERYPAWLAMLWYLKSKIKNAFLFLPLEVRAITLSVRNTEGGTPHILTSCCTSTQFSPYHFLSYFMHMQTQTHRHTLHLSILWRQLRTACCWPSSLRSRWQLFGTTWPALRRWGELFKKKKTFNLLKQL